MSYSTDPDLDLAFGKNNIDHWADVNNNKNRAEILARRAWARDQAKDELDSKLSSSAYQFPLSGPPYPVMLVRMEAYLAAMLLNESRSISETDEDKGDLKWIAKRISSFISGIRLGTIKLAGAVPTIQTTEAPMAINEFPQLDRVASVDLPDTGA